MQIFSLNLPVSDHLLLACLMLVEQAARGSWLKQLKAGQFPSIQLLSPAWRNAHLYQTFVRPKTDASNEHDAVTSWTDCLELQLLFPVVGNSLQRVDCFEHSKLVS